ncbi:MAG: efflux RND transporter permease subunit [bacterium]|nr:efflux RND transporter permease subunit [bacterium]
MSRHANPLVRFAVERRVTMAMAVLGVMVLGWISLTRLPLEYLPAFSSSSISVRASYRSSSPEEVERLIVRPLEESLGTINGIDTLSASAAADSAQVRLTFIDGTDMDMAAVEVRDRVDRVRHLLPDDLERIFIRRFQSSDIPVLRFDLSAEWPEERLFDYADQIVLRRLERLEGVAQVDVGGVREPELQINIDPARLQAHRVDLRSLSTTLRESNLNLSAGDIRDGNRKLLVRTVGEFSTPREIEQLVLRPDGLRLGDIAEVSYTLPEKEVFNYLNGVDAVTVSVNKASTANLLAVVQRAKAELEAIKGLPESEGAQFRIYQDASLDVRKGLGQLRDAGLIGGLLAIGAVFLFLRKLQTTALIAIAIPISVVATFVLMFFSRQAGLFDLTLNVVSLAGLMLALGMLVDNSVVVIESIFRHRNELGEDAKTAALSGAAEVALPITASTATTICVFLPLIFLATGGRFKLYLQNIGWTVCIVMLASLLVALTVVPMAAALILRDQTERKALWIKRLRRGYGRILRLTLERRLAFVVLITALFAGTIYLLSTVEQSVSARALERQIILKVDTPRQYSPEQTRALYSELYELIDSKRDELDIADVAYNYDRGTGRSRASWRRTRQFDIYLEDESESTLTTAKVREKLRGMLPVRAGVNIRIATQRGRHGTSGVEIQLMGDDPTVLALLAKQVTGELEGLPMVRDVDTSLESGDEEIHVSVTPERSLQAGLSSRAVANTVSSALSTRDVSQFRTEDREVGIVVQYRPEDRETFDQLKNVPVFAADSQLPLGALADFAFVEGPKAIERENRQAQVTISANTSDSRAAFGAMRSIPRILEALPFPAGYSWSFGRWNRHQQQDQLSGLFALLFALPLVYMLLAALFESFIQPLAIMFSVPFAVFGVAVAMKLAGQPWETMTTIGLIILLGVVVNNAIVLLDHINLLRKHGMTRNEAIVLGGQHRLRPIVITAVTTILGLLPLVAPFLLPSVFGTVEGRAASWAPIGLVIIGGLTTSTFLTLLILPTVYSILDDATIFARRVVRAL